MTTTMPLSNVVVSRGEAILTWQEHGSFRGRVEKVDPPHSFSVRWARPTDVEPRERNSTLVEFSLSAEGESARVRVVESGFRSLDGSEEEKAAYVEGNRRGWELELGELQGYAAKKIGLSARK